MRGAAFGSLRRLPSRSLVARKISASTATVALIGPALHCDQSRYFLHLYFATISQSTRRFAKQARRPPSEEVFNESNMNYEVMEALLASSKPLPRRLWLSKAARRAYLDVLGTRLGYAGPEHWYKIKNEDFVANRGRVLIEKHFHWSAVALLQATYDHFDFKPWLFAQVPRNYFDKKENRKQYVEWLVEKVGVKSESELKVLDFRHNHGYGLLQKYGSSPLKILESLHLDDDKISDDLDGSSIEMGDLVARRPRVLQKHYWESLENQKSFLDDILVKMGHVEGDLAAWYGHTHKDLVSLGGGGLLDRYGGSISKMLATVYSSYPWQLWRFTKMPNHFLKDDNAVRQMISFAEGELGLKEASEWYRVSLDQLKLVGVSKIFLQHGAKPLLEKAYPDLVWKETDFRVTPKAATAV